MIPREVGYGWGPRLLSALRKRWVLFRHPHANIVFGAGVYLGPGFSLHIPGRGTFIAGPGCEFRRNFRAEIHGGGKLVLGPNVAATYDVIISCTTSIEVGEGAGLGQCLYMTDGGPAWRDTEKPVRAQGYNYRPLTIGDHAVILSKCTVGHSIGERALVGANSIVTKPVPAHCFAAGAPARVLEYFGPSGGEPPELAESEPAESSAPAAPDDVSPSDGSPDPASARAPRKSRPSS